MRWNVLERNMNSRKIEEFNIFEHGRFAEDVKKLLKKNLSKAEFAEELRRTLQYYFWSKCEYEMVVTSWPPYIDSKELDRLSVEYQHHNILWGKYPHKLNVYLDIAEKIDIYDQVRLNWDVFVEYVWNQRRVK